jgi:phage shock protein PspC (stress-responsive transcriptional regulator)
MFVVTVLCLCWLFMSVMIYVISSVCVDGIQKTNKKGIYWSLC